MSEQVRSVLLGTSVLSLLAVIAMGLTVSRWTIRADEAQLLTVRRFGVLALTIQAGHFLEELATGLEQGLPELLGLSPWSLQFFVSFNLFWLAIWALSVGSLAPHRPIASFPLWFLALGCMANAVLHPLLALRAGGYFPGLLTSPLSGLAGVLLFRPLLVLTSPRTSERVP